MSTFRRKFPIACVAFAFISGAVVAKRMPPKPVAPVIANGIKYYAGGDGRDQYVVAADASSGKVVWKVKVFHNHIKSPMEEDVHWVFITNLKLVENALLVRDERSRCYSVDLKGKHVKKHQCGVVFSQ